MIKPLTSLRFIFAFIVFLSHYVVGDGSLFSEGYIGVSFFFILSGFVLAYSYNDRLASGVTSSKDFYVARLARIYPLHILTFLAALVLVVAGNNFQLWPTIANLTLIQSWIPDQSYYFSCNSPSWSISDEMFFYLLFPAIIYCIGSLSRRFKFYIIVGSLILFFGAFIFIAQLSEGVAYATFYINPLFRLFDFAIGIGLYFLWLRGLKTDHKKARKLGVLRATALEVSSILLLVIMIFFSYDLPAIVRYSIYYWLPMSAIIYVFSISHFAQGYLSRFLSLKWCVVLGEISFAFYMIHVLAIKVSLHAFKILSTHLDITLPSYINFILTLVLILVGSFMSFYWFETPVNKWIKNRYAQIKSNKEQ